MDSSLRERFARLGPVRAIDRVPSGSPAAFVLRVPQQTGLRGIRTIDAMFVLARRGLTMLRAKRCVEAVVEHGTAQVELPTVEDVGAVVTELARAGIEAEQASLERLPDAAVHRAA